jgi:hypothetical protein
MLSPLSREASVGMLFTKATLRLVQGAGEGEVGWAKAQCNIIPFASRKSRHRTVVLPERAGA